jgi:hypothetical protein
MFNLLNALKRITGLKTAQVAITNESTPEKVREPEPEPEPEKVEIGPYKQRKFHLTLDWDPAPLTYLEPISEAQCNATCRDYFHGKVVEGNYFYYPPMGTILGAGIHDVAVTFVPSKIFRYNSMEVTKKLEVKKKRATVTWNYDGGYIKFMTPLLKSHLYSGLSCEVNEGTYEFSHKEGVILEVGVHRITACYIPSESEQANYTRGYATAEVQIIGTVVPVIWELPIDIASLKPEEIPVPYRIYYPVHLPAWVYSAKCGYEGVEGEFQYSITKDVVLPVGYHTIHVTFVPTDGRKFFISKARQTVYIFHGKLVLQWPRPFSNPQGDPLDEKILNCGNSINISGKYEYDPPLGTILPIGEHTLHCNFTPDNPNYLPASISVPYKILDKREVKILWFEPEPIMYPSPIDELQLNAKLIGFGSKEKGTWVYDPPYGSVLNSGTNTLTVYFYPDKATYKVATASVSIFVERAKAKLVWKQPDPIYNGDKIYDNVLNCVCTNTKGKFIYDPPKGSTFLDPGIFALRVKFLPDDTHNFDDASTKTTIEIKQRPKILPKFRWQDPITAEPLEYGQKLTERYLNAICVNARGLFVYSPPDGSILPTGKHTITAKFDPDDHLSCLTGEITSTVIILRKRPVLRWIPVVDSTYQMTYGEYLTNQNYLTAFATYSETDLARVPGKCVYTPSPELLLESGDRTITCEFTPDDMHNYYPLQGSMQIFVRRQIPALVWEIPENYFPIHYPTALASLPPPRVLNEAIQGQYFFNVDMHGFLPQGKHTIVCNFSPFDIINFLGNTATIEIEIFPTIPIVVWNPLNSVFPYETMLTVEKHGNAYSKLAGGKFVYRPTMGCILNATTELSDQDAVDDLLDAAAITTLSTPAVANPPADAAGESKEEEAEKKEEEPSNESEKHGAVDKKEETKDESAANEENKEASTAAFTAKKVPPTATKVTLDQLQGGETWEAYPDLIPKGKFLLKLTYIPDDELNYQRVHLTRFFTIVKKSPILSWEYPWKLKFGIPLTARNVLKANLSEKENTSYAMEKLAKGRFEYDPPAGTILPAGKNREVHITFYPPPEQEKNYTNATKTAYIEVLKSSPRVIWKPKVLTIFEGNELNEEHLNAYVKKKHIFKGKLIYTPSLGEVLAPGRYNIEVKFVPAEPQNVLPKTLTRTFQVIKNTPKIAWEPDPMSGELKAVKQA